MFGHKFWSDLQTNSCYFLKVRMKIILNNEIDLKMKYLEGRSVLMKNIMDILNLNEKKLCCFFLIKENIWKSSRRIT